MGDLVRRGRGVTVWRVVSISDQFISLLSTKDGWTTSSVQPHKASTLTLVDGGLDPAQEAG
ncbi:hypothetical protein [Luteococcus sp.]|uniref:hypothetical protein n=1 Tax=Luteococcus sp. TaxID=1969402 RepID=UPI003736FB78